MSRPTTGVTQNTDIRENCLRLCHFNKTSKQKEMLAFCLTRLVFCFRISLQHAFCDSIGSSSGLTPIHNARGVECEDDPCSEDQCCEGGCCLQYACPLGYKEVAYASHIPSDASGVPMEPCCVYGKLCGISVTCRNLFHW